jgi:catalase
VFDLEAIMGKTGDQTSDPTQRWDDEDNRPKTDLGKITVEAIAPQATCDAGIFLPGNVVDGIAGPSDDPIFACGRPPMSCHLPAGRLREATARLKALEAAGR